MKGIQLKNYEPEIETVRDSDGKIVRGLKTGDILRQNQALILLLHKGELKESPCTGCGIGDMLLDSDPLYWRTEIREQLEMDGQKVDRVETGSDGITIEAGYRE